MTVSRVRCSSRVVAAFLLIATLRGLPHFAQDDLACDIPQASAPHDESRHGLNVPGKAGARDHCALCHWSRLLRSPLTALGITVMPEAATPIDHGPPAAAPIAPVLQLLSARAPPTTLL